jgi:hypothetical protein
MIEKTQILQPIVYRIPGYVSDTDTRWIHIRGLSEKINANKSDTFFNAYWATMAHYRIHLGPATAHLKGY